VTRGAEEVRIGGVIMPRWRAGFASGASIVAIGAAWAILALLTYGMADIIGIVVVAALLVLLGTWIMWASYDQR